MIDVLTILQETTATGGFHGTHPPPAQRIANVRQELSRNKELYQVQDTGSSRASRFASFAELIKQPL
jgi:predicted Zn-dependent protease